MRDPSIHAFFRRTAGRAVALLAIALLAAPPVAGQAARADVHVSQSGRTFVIEATLEVDVPVAVAWDVLTDFDRMDAFVPNLADSRVITRNGQRLTILQHGVARFGPLAWRFESERVVTLAPMVSIASLQTRGTMERVESLTTFAPAGTGTRLDYRVEVVPGALYPDAVTRRFLGHEVAEQFDAIAREMLRRQQAARTPPS